MSWKSSDFPVGTRCLKLEVNLDCLRFGWDKQSRLDVETGSINLLPGKPVNVKRVRLVEERRYTVLFLSLVLRTVSKVQPYTEAWEAA